MKLKYFTLISFLTVLFSGCAKERSFNPQADNSDLMPISISGSINQEYLTKANEGGFCDKDIIGVYVVDYENNNPGELKNKGNRANNLMFTFDEQQHKWMPAYEIYWKDKETHIDVYGYYPFGSPEDVEHYSFEVQRDQSKTAENDKLAGYEASDFLWGVSKDNSPTSNVINLGFEHKMAGVRVSLVEGEGFDDGEWVTLQKNVIILNTIRKSTINLKTGEVTSAGDIDDNGIVTQKYNDDFRAIVVPQTVSGGKKLVAVSVGTQSYFFTRTEDMVYAPGKQHNFTITVKKRQGSGGLEFTLTSESITVWENDPVSHDAITREYVIVNVDEPGTLDKCIAAAGKDLTKLRNLKLTGKINSRDMAVMRFMMSRLSSLNMKEVEIVEGEGGQLKAEDGYSGGDGVYYGNENDEIPNYAFNGKKTLTSLVLPDKLKKIGGEQGGGRGAFNGCENLAGSLIIPEGVVEIGPAAFNGCVGLTGQLVLPSTLKILGNADINQPSSAFHNGVFAGCNFVCEVKLPEGLEVLGDGTFYNCHNIYGEIHFPENLKEIGDGAFWGCENLTGSIVIPQGVSVIPNNCFRDTGMGGTLTLHDGITSIGSYAFANTGLKGELRLPKDLDVISSYAFYNCDFSGNLLLPKGLFTIGDKAFAYNWRLTGTLEIPDNVISIGAGAFAKCRSLEGVIFPEGLESIRCAYDWNEDAGAFQDCFGIGRIVCKGTIPAYIQEGAFYGVAKDNFTLEVPESAIQQYQAADGWKDFKRISAYRNLVIRPSMATAINTSVTRDLVLNADDQWYVESQPDWVELDKTSGTGKTDIKLTFKQMAQGSGTREGDIVFMLQGLDYKTQCHVSQYDYQYAEDQFITLQSASKGSGVNIVILGDGYNAKDVSEGKLLENAQEAYGHFFSIEPYKTYKDYFNVYTAVSVSPESGIGSVNTIIYNKFNTTAKGGVTLGGRNGESDDRAIIKYAMGAETVNEENINQALIIMLPNTYDYGGICYMYDEGLSIAYCPMSNYGYPLDFRGVVQHEAGGHGFGHLGDEYIYHNAFIEACNCNCCPHQFELMAAQSKGWFDNLSLSGKMSEVPWSHLIFHEKYNQFVDIFEGGYMHSRGVYRSEQNSCMNNDIPYYSTISRESIVKRIMNYSGEAYSFDDFVAKDVIDVPNTEVDTKFVIENVGRGVIKSFQQEPVFRGHVPQINQ